MTKYSEINQIIRFYPTNIDTLNCEEVWSSESFNLFVYIPFCRRKCHFCILNSAKLSKKKIDVFFKALDKELMLYEDTAYFKSKLVNSLWIGGGTPSVVPIDKIKCLLDHSMQNFNFTNNAEITIEVNLEDLDENFLKQIVDTKINRLSIGVQTFNNKYLKILGRTYNFDNILYVFDLLSKFSELDISIDLMYRYPGQTIEELVEDLEYIKRIDLIQHVTIHPLILFPSLELYKKIKSGILPKQPSLKRYLEMYNILLDNLSNGKPFYQYSPYSFAKKDKECAYNISRWRIPQQECLSIGPGGFSQANNYIYCTEHDIDKYMEIVGKGIIPILEGKKLNYREMLSRYLVIGSRLLSVDLDMYRELTGFEARELFKDSFNWLLKEGLININDNKMDLTDKGKALIIDVSKAFYSENVEVLQPQYRILNLYQKGSNNLLSDVIENE